MALKCNGCGNDAAYRVSVREFQGEHVEICNRCGIVSGANVPDVYWPGHAYKSANICDENGDPILLTSRRHKADVMKKQGLAEAGDRFHGSRMEALKAMVPERKNNSRDVVREAIQKAAEQMRRKYYR